MTCSSAQFGPYKTAASTWHKLFHHYIYYQPTWGHSWLKKVPSETTAPQQRNLMHQKTRRRRSPVMKQGDAILFLLEWCPCKLEGCQTIDAKRDCQDVLLLQCDSTGLAMIPVYDGCNSALCTIHVPYPSSTRVYPGAVWVGMPPCPIQSQGMWPGYPSPQFYVWPLGHPADWKPCLPYLLGLPLPVSFEGQKNRSNSAAQILSLRWREPRPLHPPQLWTASELIAAETAKNDPHTLPHPTKHQANAYWSFGCIGTILCAFFKFIFRSWHPGPWLWINRKASYIEGYCRKHLSSRIPWLTLYENEENKSTILSLRLQKLSHHCSINSICKCPSNWDPFTLII